LSAAPLGDSRAMLHGRPHVVTRQITPLSYRASDHLPPEPETSTGAEDMPPSARRGSRRNSPVDPRRPASHASAPSLATQPLPSSLSNRARDLMLSEADDEVTSQDAPVVGKLSPRKTSPVALRCAIMHAPTPHVMSRRAPSVRFQPNDNVPLEIQSDAGDEDPRKPSPGVQLGVLQRTPHVVTRQCTPLSYRVKDHLPSESDGEGCDRDVLVATKQHSRKASPVRLLRSLNRDRRGTQEPAGQSVVQEPPCAPGFVVQHDAWARISRATPRLSSRSPAPQLTPRPMRRSWSSDRPRSWVGEPVGPMLVQDAHVRSMVSSAGERSGTPIGERVGRDLRAAQRVQSRSPTPKGAIVLSRDADRERHRAVPVTIWRGLDQERQPAVPAEPASGNRGAVQSPSSFVAASSPARAELSPVGPWSSPAAAPCAVKPPEQGDLPDLQAAVVPDQSKAEPQQNAPETPVLQTGRCRTASREPPLQTETSARGPATLRSPESRLSSGTVREARTPTRPRHAALNVAAPFSSRSTLPANFRQTAPLAGRISTPSMVPAQGAMCSPAPPPAGARVVSPSPGVPHCIGSGPSSVPTPGLPYAAGSPCYPAVPLTGTRPLALGGAPPPPVFISVNGKLRCSPAPVAVGRPGSQSTL